MKLKKFLCERFEFYSILAGCFLDPIQIDIGKTCQDQIVYVIKF